MEVKFNLRDGQTITAEFEDDLGDLEDFLSRAEVLRASRGARQ